MIEAIVIGGSAGAIDALLTILPALDERVRCPILVVVHLPPEEPSLLPEILRQVCGRAVVEAEDKMPLAPGSIVIAPPNYHLLVERDRTLSLSVDELVNFSRPAIDVLFTSAADAFGPALVGVVLSGANEDGAEGLARIRDAGGVTIVQDSRSSQITLMPEAAARAVGPSVHVIGAGDLGAFLVRTAGATSTGGR